MYKNFVLIFIGKETNATRVYRTKYCTIHPNYKIISNTAFNDIAVCEIYGTIFFNAKVGPVCLPFQHHCDSFGGVFVYILGWYIPIISYIQFNFTF